MIEEKLLFIQQQISKALSYDKKRQKYKNVKNGILTIKKK